MKESIFLSVARKSETVDSIMNHLNSIFSQTEYNNVMTYGRFYLCLLIIAGIFAGAALYVKKVKY